MIGRSNGAIGESSHARDAFIHYGAASDRVLVATMPLDVTGLHDRVMKSKQTPECRTLQERLSKPVLLSIGQIIQRKGYHELFAIYAQLLATHPKTSLLIAGDGPDRCHFEAITKQKGWQNVHFVGFVQANELPLYFAASDAFIFHTLYDPFGLVLSEAMAAEVPVIHPSMQWPPKISSRKESRAIASILVRPKPPRTRCAGCSSYLPNSEITWCRPHIAACSLR